jgi:hypothetical protein
MWRTCACREDILSKMHTWLFPNQQEQRFQRTVLSFMMPPDIYAKLNQEYRLIPAGFVHSGYEQGIDA